MQPWTPADLQSYLDATKFPAEIIHVTAETPTVPAAAAALNVTVDEIVKTVIFLIEETPYAIIANGVRRVDPRKLAARFGVSRKKVKLADADSVTALTGYLPGAVPPVGHRQKLPVLMDQMVRRHEVIYAGGGGIAAMLRVRSEDLWRHTDAELLSVLETETGEE